MRWLPFGFLLLVTLVFGARHASAILYSLMGPWSAVGIEQDGSTTHMALGPSLAAPEWVDARFRGYERLANSRVYAGLTRAPIFLK